MTVSEIRDLIQTWREGNKEYFYRVDFDSESLRRTGILHIMVGPQPEKQKEALSMCREIAQHFREKTGHEVWLEAKLFYHAK